MCLEFPLLRVSPLTSISFPNPALALRFWLSESCSRTSSLMLGVLIAYGVAACLTQLNFWVATLDLGCCSLMLEQEVAES